MNTDEHSEKIAELLYGFIDQLTLGQYPTFYFSADVLETTPRTILARYKAYFLDPEELSTIPDGLNYEEKSAKLEWPTGWPRPLFGLSADTIASNLAAHASSACRFSRS